jgi:ADP-heptose:LPS heptosyltransferase
VLTTPVIRTLKSYFPDVRIHFVVKSSFYDVLKHHPQIDHLHPYQPESEQNLIRTLKSISFDAVIDLQNDSISKRIRSALTVQPSIIFKANVQKYLMTALKIKRPITHIAQRNLETLIPLVGEDYVKDAYKHVQLEFFIPNEIRSTAAELVKNQLWNQVPYAFVIGASYPTKQWVNQHIIETIQTLHLPVILLGGKEDRPKAEQIASQLTVPFLNAVGQFDLLTSSALMAQCQWVITPDTGLMHIAAALKLPIVSLWGNTVPELGMTPIATVYQIAEVKGLWCRPCSKLGFNRCPLGHFKCMNQLLPQQVIDLVESIKN